MPNVKSCPLPACNGEDLDIRFIDRGTGKNGFLGCARCECCAQAAMKRGDAQAAILAFKRAVAAQGKLDTMIEEAT